MRTRIPTWFLVLTTVLALFQAAKAAPSVQLVPLKDSTRLLVGGKLVASFRTENGGLSAQERAELAGNRLKELIENGLQPDQVEIRERTDNWGVYAAGGLIMIATQEEADERKTDPKSVAQLWAGNLKEGLRLVAKGGKASASQPAKVAKAAPKPKVRSGKLGLDATQLAVPVGETRSVEVTGGSGAISAEIDDSDLATVDVAPGNNAVVVRGLKPGKAVVTVRRGSVTDSVIVWIKKYAGVLGAPAIAKVTGTVAPASFVRKAAEERILDSVTLEPGATVRVTGEITGIRAVGRGRSIEVEVPVTITGDGYLPVKGTARLTVQNLELPSAPTNVLLYSNDPESIREYGTLFQGMIDPKGPGRLLFHHQNRMGRALTFGVHLLNPSDEEVEVQIIPGDAGPIIDTIQVGHRAAERYLSASLSDQGYVIRVPARGSRTIYSARVGNILTVSGIYGVRILSGGPLVASVTASAQPLTPKVTDEVVAAARIEPHTYPSPTKVQKFKYVVGESWTFIPFGRHPITGRRPNRKLFGNYGVLYDVTVDVSNPTGETKTVQVLMSAEAGWARGAFVIDGKVIEAPQIAPPGEAVLWSVKLGPNETRAVRIQGIPVSGSAYPVSLVVRS